MMKQLKRLAVIGLLATVFFPAAAIASTQPLTNNPYENSSEPEVELSGEEVLVKIPPIINTSRQIYQQISTGNFEGAFAGILGILGELGLLNPADEAARVASESLKPGGAQTGEPYANPKTPQEVYDLQRYVDLVRSTIPQRLSQIAFSPAGQQEMAQQAEATEMVQQASLVAQQGVSAAHQASAQQAQTNLSHASNVTAKNDEAQTAKASQDVLKALAAQNADLANIGAGTSAQLAQLGEAEAYQSAQLSAANVLLSGLNDKTQTLEILGASQNDLLAQVDAALDQEREYQQFKDSLRQNQAYHTTQWLFIPGLNPQGGQP